MIPLTTATTITVWQNDTPRPSEDVLLLLYDGVNAWTTTGYYDATEWRVYSLNEEGTRDLRDGERVLAYAFPNIPDIAPFLEPT